MANSSRLLATISRLNPVLQSVILIVANIYNVITARTIKAKYASKYTQKYTHAYRQIHQKEQLQEEGQR
jgi:hypothetical protein